MKKDISLLKYTSLLALLVLLGLYVSDAYHSEKAQVSKEARYIFLNAVDNVRGDALEGILDHIRLEDQVDSIAVVTMQTDEHGKANFRSRLRIEVDTDSSGSKDIINEEWHSEEIETILKGKEGFKLRFYRDTGFAVAVKERVRSTMEDEGLNINYDILMKDSMNMSSDSMIMDLQEHFEFSVQQSTLDILKEIWPEVLFSFFVFLIVALSFSLLEKNYQEQLALNSARRQFVQNMTHELKTPVTAISVALEAMDSFGVDQESQRKDYLKNSRKEIKRLDRLIDKVMESSTVGGQKSDLIELETVQLPNLIQEVNLRLKAAYPDQDFNVDYQEVNEKEALGNIQMMDAIITNILENALKYSGVNKTLIKISSRILGDRVVIDIVDNGNGVAPAAIKHIFDRFFRGQQGDRHDVGGYGLGLSLARDYARAMKGELELMQKSKADKPEGAHFRLTLLKA